MKNFALSEKNEMKSGQFIIVDTLLTILAWTAWIATLCIFQKTHVIVAGSSKCSKCSTTPFPCDRYYSCGFSELWFEGITRKLIKFTCSMRNRRS